MKRMENTGRIRRTLLASARAAVYPPLAPDEIESELIVGSEVDCAHIVMLLEQKLLPSAVGIELLRAIDRLRRSNFQPLANRVPLRGLYLMYEDYLIEFAGPEVGGALQIHRSRNDYNATAQKMAARDPLRKLTAEGARLVAILLAKARRYKETLMPVYTHGQAALPGSYGFYLSGVAEALMRELEGLAAASAQIETCPLGAGAAVGAAAPIRPERTANLLGFREPCSHALDAVASRDWALRLLASCATLGVLLSRIAADLSQWLTAEFGFLCLPDSLVGSSSAMPQKRNPFLLEHVAGRAAALPSAFSAAAAAMSRAPFTNAIAANNEGIRPLQDAMKECRECLLLLRLLIASAVPDSPIMRARAEAGATAAAYTAHVLCARYQLSFRSAHRLLGEAITASGEQTGRYCAEFVRHHLDGHGFPVTPAEIDPQHAFAAYCSDGGAAPGAVLRNVEQTSRRLATFISRARATQSRWLQARQQIEHEVRRWLDKSAVSFAMSSAEVSC